MKDKLFRAIDRLPNSTNAIRCRWFQAIMIMSVVVIGWSLVTGPGTVQTVGLSCSFFAVGLCIGTRDLSISPKCPA